MLIQGLLFEGLKRMRRGRGNERERDKTSVKVDVR